MAKMKPLIDEDDEAFDSFDMANTGAVQFAKMLPCALIQFDPAVKDLFAFNEALCNQIAESIKENGFNQGNPIHVWVKNDGTTILLDGHHRLEAAKRAGLLEIPCAEMRFNSTKDALLYAYEQQLDRRNLNDEDLLSAIDTFINLGGKHLNRDAIAAKVGISARTVSKVQAILKDDEATQDVKENGKSVNAAYNDLMERKHPKRQETAGDTKTDDEPATDDLDAFDDISDSLEDTSGEPKGIVIGDHSDHIERPTYKLSAEEDTERTRERKKAYEMGFTEGFAQAANFAIGKFLEYDTAYVYDCIFCREPIQFSFLSNLKNNVSEMSDLHNLRLQVKEMGVKDFNPLPLDLPPVIETENGEQTLGFGAEEDSEADDEVANDSTEPSDMDFDIEFEGEDE